MPVYVGTLVFQGAWMDQPAGLCKGDMNESGKNVVVSSAWNEEGVVVCILGGPRWRVWELSSLRVIK